MRARLGWLSVILIAACSDTTDPTQAGAVLTGRWAADEVGFVALRSAAELNLLCSYVAIDHAIPIDASGRFEVNGVLHHYRGRDRVTLRGEQREDPGAAT